MLLTHYIPTNHTQEPAFPLFFPDFGLDFPSHFRVVEEELFDGITALAEFITIVAEPATAFLDDAQVYAHVDDFTHSWRYLLRR